LIVALAAVVCPLLYHLLPAGEAPSLSTSAVQAMAVLFMLGATFTLGRNFSVVPQYRWLVRTGPYMLVRHPMYAGYLAFDAAHAFEHASSLALAIWLGELALLDWRARREEALLSHADPGYLEYMLQVRWRFFPHLI
jgi:protein-S-isoprenylcysteine O-methyltransferase Ste14